MEYFKMDLEKFKRRHLFRVQYPGTRTKFTPEVGLQAQDTVTFYDETTSEGPNGGFAGAITKHLHWNKAYGSSFISLFGRRQHANKWARKRCMANGKACKVLTIDVEKLGEDTYVFDAAQIVKTLSLDVYRGARASVKDEFLVAWKVPVDAIIETDIVQYRNRESHNQLKDLDIGDDLGLEQLFADC